MIYLGVHILNVLALLRPGPMTNTNSRQEIGRKMGSTTLSGSPSGPQLPLESLLCTAPLKKWKMSPPWDCLQVDIESTVVLEGVARLSDYAFSHCSNMTSVKIQKLALPFVRKCFFSCDDLESIIIPDPVTP